MVFRVHKNENYTHMSNYHFKDKRLTLKAKGLLSLMLSLPPEWDFNIKGLASLSQDGESAVRSGLLELETYGYLIRSRLHENGLISDWKYDIYEQPDTENQEVENQQLDNNAQLNTYILNTKEIDNSISINTNTTPKEEYSVNDFVSDYNSICKSLPKCVKLTLQRRKNIQSILKKYSKEEVLQVFNSVESSDFCKGINDRGWKADIDFILRESKFVSVLEGKYDNKGIQVSMQKDDVFSEYGKVHTGKKVGALVNEQF